MKPVCFNQQEATLPRSIFVKWFNSQIVPWQKNPEHSYHGDLHFRTTLEKRLHNTSLDELAERIFSYVKRCTPEQLQTLQQTMSSAGYEFGLQSIEYAVIELAEAGSFSKLQALYPTLTWDALVDSLGVHESMSGKYMPLYAKDMIEYFEKTPMDAEERDSASLTMLVALQQNSLSTKDVIAVMSQLPTPDLKEHSNFIQATDNTVSLLYDTPPALVEAHAPKLAEQFQRLHEGWDIRYPAAVLALLMQQRHNRKYQVPPIHLLTYSTGAEDAKLAQLVLGQAPNVEPGEAPVVGRLRLMLQLYEPEDVMSAMLAGDERFIAPSEAYILPNDENLFQDVGQP